MPYKTVVVHLADDPEHGERLKLAVGLGRRFEAHLDVVYTTDLVELPAVTIGRAASQAFLDEVAQERKYHIAEVMAEADRLCQDALSWEWHAIREGQIDDAVARYAHLADLMIAEQPTREILEHRGTFRLSELLLLASGCPTLVVPSKWDRVDLGRRVLVAWKNTRESISSIRAALPFLTTAEQVLVLAYADDTRADPPGSDIVTYLGRHGVKADIVATNPRGRDVITDTANAHDCDLIVMGAVGHSRLRDLFVGRSTSHVMQDSKVPVLLRH